MNKFLLFGLLIFLAACTTGNEPIPFAEGSQEKIDNALIIDYLNEKGLSAEHTESGIYYIIEDAGADEHPDMTSKIEAHYTGTLLDGTKFDSSVDKGSPLKFGLNGVIAGWGEAIPLLGKGGKGKFIIPSGLAYGERQVGRNIPANSVLIFDIELIDFQ